jgi:Thymidylate synthase
MTTNQVYKNCLNALSTRTHFICAPRGMKTKERLHDHIFFNSANPIITIPERKLSYAFMAAEAHWILSGHNHVAALVPFAPNYIRFSDDGETLAGAYGPPFLEQIDYVVETLEKDPTSRQAVVSLWNRNPKPSKDIPCTTTVQFVIRNGSLYTIASMRSNDAWLGLPYDLFSFTMMGLLVSIKLKQKGIWLKPGDTSIFAGSRHLYEKDWLNVSLVIAGKDDGDNFDISQHKYNTPDELLNDLGCARLCRSDDSLSTPIAKHFRSLCVQQSQTQ